MPARRSVFRRDQTWTHVSRLGDASFGLADEAAGVAYDPQNLFGMVIGTADSEVPVGEAVEGEERATKSLKGALEDLFGAEAVVVKKYDE